MIESEINDHPVIKVLIIEDNPGDARLIREMLDGSQYQLFSLYHADTLHEGCNKLSDDWFDVVLLDIGLPDSIGIDAIEAIRGKYPELPIIMLTGLDDEKTAISSLKMGAQDYLVKGHIDTRHLQRAIQYAIERKRTAEIILSKQRFIQHVADTTPDILYIFNLSKHYLVYANQALGNVLGYSSEEINKLGTFIYSELSHPDDLSFVHEYVRKFFVSKNNEIVDLECRVRHKNGQWRWIHLRSVVYSRDKDGSTIEILGRAHDITNRKETEQQIRASLEEKELLLREIHHRIKNNMAVVSSLLSLQSRYVVDERDRNLFDDSIARIKSMALIHEKLYKSPNLAVVNLGTYISELTSSMLMFYKVHPDRIKLNADVSDISLGIDSAIPCGLIVNELLSNSFKHAFPDNAAGEINVSLHDISKTQSSSSLIELVIRDNGIGIPAHVDISKSNSLGLTLINALVKQLHGKIEMSRKNGMEYRISFEKTILG